MRHLIQEALLGRVPGVLHVSLTNLRLKASIAMVLKTPRGKLGSCFLFWSREKRGSGPGDNDGGSMGMMMMNSIIIEVQW